MYKQPVTAPLELGFTGFVGDEQADRRVHGGPDKAVHLYPACHYATLAERFPDAAARLIPGSLGENLSTPDLAENDVRLGDIWRLGSARLQVCQPRNPCWKIDERFACDGMAAFIAEKRITGWYWRVLETGRVQPGDPLEIESASSSFTLAEAMRLWHSHRPDLDTLAALAAAPGIAPHWQQKIRQRLDWLRQHPGQPDRAPKAFHVKPEAT